MTVIASNEVSTRNHSAAYTQEQKLRAARTVITYTIADVFSLSEEEILWVSYHVDNALKPFLDSEETTISSAVLLELNTGEYSKRLDEMGKSYSTPRASHGEVAEVDLIDWSSVLSNVITQSYRVRPMDAATLSGKINGILTELGVGDPVSPRASKYLPSAVRYLALR